DGVKRLVHGRPRQVVHGRVDDAEVLFFAGLEVKHLAHAQPGVADQRSSRLQHELAVAKTACIDFGQKLLPQCVCGGWCVVVVVDAQSTAKINMVNGDAGCFDLLDQVEQLVCSVQI